MTTRIAAFALSLLGAVGAWAGQAPELSGAVAYTEVLRFDYDQDRVTSRVQFWLEFRGRTEAATAGAVADQAPEGQIFYYLADLDKKVSVPRWHMGFSMMEEPPPSGPYPMKNLSIEGNKASFEAFGMKWTVIDGGEGHTADRVTVDDGFRVKEMKMYGGDLRVGPPK